MAASRWPGRSEEHTSELQSLTNLVCRLLLGKKKRTAEVQALTIRALRRGPRPVEHPAVLDQRPGPQAAGHHYPVGVVLLFFLMIRRPPKPPLFPSPALFR